MVHGNFRYALVACLLAIAIGIEEYEISYGSSGRELKVNINNILAGGKFYCDSTITHVVQFEGLTGPSGTVLICTAYSPAGNC